MLADDVAETRNMYCLAYESGTHVGILSDCHPLQTKHLSLVASGTMNFAIKIDFVERNDANCVKCQP